MGPKPGDFVMLSYGMWGDGGQLGFILRRARDGRRWAVRKYRRKSQRWTDRMLVEPHEIKEEPVADCTWTQRAIRQFIDNGHKATA